MPSTARPRVQYRRANTATDRRLDPRGTATVARPDRDEAELIDDILDAWKATPGSRRNARYTLSAFADWLAVERASTLTAATRADCKAYLEVRAGEVGAATVVKNWSQLRAWYEVAASDITNPLAGRISPMANITMPDAPTYTMTKVATPDEYLALVRALDQRTGVGLRDATMLSLMYRSGLRVGELAQITRADFDLDGRRVHLGQTKNGDPRLPPLHPETITVARRYLRRRTDGPGPMFINVGGRRASVRLTTSAIQTMVKKAARRAGVDVTPHSLRRGFVVEYLANGGDNATLMIICGWATETMIYRYLGEQRAATAQRVFDQVAARQVAVAGRTLRAVR